MPSWYTDYLLTRLKIPTGVAGYDIEYSCTSPSIVRTASRPDLVHPSYKACVYVCTGIL